MGPHVRRGGADHGHRPRGLDAGHLGARGQARPDRRHQHLPGDRYPPRPAAQRGGPVGEADRRLHLRVGELARRRAPAAEPVQGRPARAPPSRRGTRCGRRKGPHGSRGSWRSCSERPSAASTETVVRLRSRGDSAGSAHTCPKSTSSVSRTSSGAVPPSSSWARDFPVSDNSARLYSGTSSTLAFHSSQHALLPNPPGGSPVRGSSQPGSDRAPLDRAVGVAAGADWWHGS